MGAVVHLFIKIDTNTNTNTSINANTNRDTCMKRTLDKHKSGCGNSTLVVCLFRLANPWPP